MANMKDIMRCLGQNPSDEEWDKIKASIGSDEVEREKFEEILAGKMKDANPADELLESFKGFDK